MTVEEQLSVIIKSKYKSIKAFADDNNFKCSTIHSILGHSIENSSVTTILAIFDALNLDVESIPTGTLTFKPTPKIENLTETDIELITAYEKSPYQEAINKLLDIDKKGET